MDKIFRRIIFILLGFVILFYSITSLEDLLSLDEKLS